MTTVRRESYRSQVLPQLGNPFILPTAANFCQRTYPLHFGEELHQVRTIVVSSNQQRRHPQLRQLVGNRNGII